MKTALGNAWEGTRAFRPVLAVVIVLVVVFSVWQPAFRTGNNIQNVFTSVSVMWVIAMGMTFVLLSGGIDLSVSAIASFCGIFVAKVLETQSLPPVLVLILAVVVGGVLGAVLNGIFVGFFRLSVFVVTLASMTTLSGVVLVWTNTQSLYMENPIATKLAVTRFLGIQMPIWIMAAVFLVFLFVQKRTYFGRDIYAVGGSYVAARLSGIRTYRTLIMVYALSGAVSGFAGILAIGRIGAATPVVDLGLALNAVAAVLLGGTALSGGSGSVVGTALGCLFIGVLQNGLNLVGLGSSWQYVVTGVILLLSVVGSRFTRSRRAGRSSTGKPGQLPPAEATQSASSGLSASASPVLPKADTGPDQEP